MFDDDGNLRVVLVAQTLNVSEEEARTALTEMYHRGAVEPLGDDTYRLISRYEAVRYGLEKLDEMTYSDFKVLWRDAQTD